MTYLDGEWVKEDVNYSHFLIMIFKYIFYVKN